MAERHDLDAPPAPATLKITLQEQAPVGPSPGAERDAFDEPTGASAEISSTEASG